MNKLGAHFREISNDSHAIVKSLQSEEALHQYLSTLLVRLWLPEETVIFKPNVKHNINSLYIKEVDDKFERNTILKYAKKYHKIYSNRSDTAGPVFIFEPSFSDLEMEEENKLNEARAFLDEFDRKVYKEDKKFKKLRKSI